MRLLRWEYLYNFLHLILIAVGAPSAPSPQIVTTQNAVKMCPDFMKCVTHCGTPTDCLMVSCCGATSLPTCLNHVRYCGSPTIQTTPSRKCRKSSDCLVNPSGASQSLCCSSSPGTSDGLCAEVPCSALCPSLLPGSTSLLLNQLSVNSAVLLPPNGAATSSVASGAPPSKL